MRKLILMSVLLLASASAHAEQIQSLDVAANDTPAATTTTTPQPLPPAAQTDTPKPEASEPVARPRMSKPRITARGRDSTEAKARRIAAKYGVYW